MVMGFLPLTNVIGRLDTPLSRIRESLRPFVTRLWLRGANRTLGHLPWAVICESRENVWLLDTRVSKGNHNGEGRSRHGLRKQLTNPRMA